MIKKLSELISKINIKKNSSNSKNPDIAGIAHDTRKVGDGYLFICISGHNQDGHEFAEKAIELGAVALVVERFQDKLKDIPQVIVEDARKTEALLAAVFYDYPSRKMKVIGITGTNGKTTTTYLIESILKAAGYKPGIIGTVTYRYAGKIVDAHNTTPSSLELNQLMAEMVNHGCDHLVMEVSSHALVQNRVDGIDIDYGIYTHISRDHLDYHETMEKYLAAKCLLFSKLGNDFDKGFPKKSIINIDDAHAETVIESSTVPIVTYGMKSNANIYSDNIETGKDHLHFNINTPSGNMDISLHLVGLFNVYNALAAATVTQVLGIPIKKIKEGLEKIEYVPGRFQTIKKGQDFVVIIDYAHTDDALLNLLKSARPLTKGKLIVVFGAGGDRDRGKRPLMGEVAAKLSDVIIVTSDNPRSEDPARIALDIEIGMKRVPKVEDRYKIILDREEAIKDAIYSAKPGDTVVIAGKGHENYQVIADNKIHFDDVEITGKYLNEILGRTNIGTSKNTGNM